jgi:hypothetical protein
MDCHKNAAFFHSVSANLVPRSHKSVEAPTVNAEGRNETIRKWRSVTQWLCDDDSHHDPEASRSQALGQRAGAKQGDFDGYECGG